MMHLTTQADLGLTGIQQSDKDDMRNAGFTDCIYPTSLSLWMAQQMDSRLTIHSYRKDSFKEVPKKQLLDGLDSVYSELRQRILRDEPLIMTAADVANYVAFFAARDLIREGKAK